MTTSEFSNEFDILFNSYRRARKYDDKLSYDTIEIDEYEKSVLLTRSQEDIIKSYYTGKNPFGDSFEKTEEMRSFLNTLTFITELSPLQETTPNTQLYTDKHSFNIEIPKDILFRVHEEVLILNNNPICGKYTSLEVYPAKLDEVHKILDNPFRTANNKRALRFDISDKTKDAHNMFYIVDSTYKTSSIVVRLVYIKKPSPIILINLPNNINIENSNTISECNLNSLIHMDILRGAVDMAIGIHYPKNNNDKK